MGVTFGSDDVNSMIFTSITMTIFGIYILYKTVRSDIQFPNIITN